MIKSILWDTLIVLGLLLLLLGGLMINDLFPAGNNREPATDGEIAGITLNDSKIELLDDYPLPETGRKIELTIPEGYTALQTAALLDDKDLMEEDQFMKAMVLFDIEKRIKPGEYQFNNDEKPFDILEKIMTGN
ncbi:MAG: hypothetical protein ACOCZR_00330 [Halanaerobiales bacterium]